LLPIVLGCLVIHALRISHNLSVRSIAAQRRVVDAYTPQIQVGNVTCLTHLTRRKMQASKIRSRYRLVVGTLINSLNSCEMLAYAMYSLSSVRPLRSDPLNREAIREYVVKHVIRQLSWQWLYRMRR